LEVFELAKRIASALILGPLFLAVIYFNPAVMVIGMCANIAYELLRATKVARHNSMYFWTTLAAVLLPLGEYAGWGDWYFRLVTLGLFCALFSVAIQKYGTPGAIGLEHIMICIFAGLLIPTLLSSLIRLRAMEQGRFLVFLPVISAFLTDIGAYFTGVFFGKHRGITKVSPNKSLEGYLGGIVFGGVFMLLYGAALGVLTGVPVSYPLMAVYGLCGSAVTELGDLSFSLIKRQYGVKDYGNLIPGHGGMLDRFDSMIFAAPMLLVLVELFPPLG